MKTLSILTVVLTLASITASPAQAAYKLRWEEGASLVSPPDFAYDYEHSMYFSPEAFDRLVKGRSARQFAEDVVNANRGIPAVIEHESLAGGTLISKQDAYYYTIDGSDEITSVFVEVGGRGSLPSYSGQTSQDVLCFFKGPRAGTCGLGDDT